MIRRWFRFVGLLLGLIACVPLHYSWKLVGAKSPWPRRFLFWVGYVAGVRLNVQGEYRRTNTLFVANHATWLDIMVIGGTTGAAFVAKEELKASKFVHWLSSLNDSVWIQRADRRGISGQIDQIRSVLETGRAVCFFPEATTKGGRDVLPFRASLFSALYPPIPGLVVQPIAIDYGDKQDVVAWGDESGGAVTRRIFSSKGTVPTRVAFLPPIVPAQTDRKRIAVDSRQLIVDALGNLADHEGSGLEALAGSLYPAR
jgi:1-acyl-sn-glycerol-3-phosphate acyltransferase